VLAREAGMPEAEVQRLLGEGRALPPDAALDLARA
jgi:hypothetical protein